MAYWLLKTEPEEFSWNDQVERGAKGETWSGVRNYIARGNLKKMKKGERAFFYHTGKEKQVVGIAEVIEEAYPDPTADGGGWVCVDMRAVEPLPRPVSLAEIKADPALKDMALVRYSRLSVSAVAPEAWQHILTLAGRKRP